MIEVRLWYRDGLFWRRESKHWERDFYGFDVDGLGDLIFNTCSRIIDTKEITTWSEQALMECGCLLEDRKRWPDYFHPGEHSANNWFQWKWSMLLYKLEIRRNHMYRPQNNMTRDPYIAFYAAIEMHPNVFSCVKIPWWLYRPSVFAWRKYLLKGYKWSLFIHKAGRWINGLFPQKEYVIRLTEYMDKAIKMKQDGGINQ